MASLNQDRFAVFDSTGRALMPFAANPVKPEQWQHLDPTWFYLVGEPREPALLWPQNGFWCLERLTFQGLGNLLGTTLAQAIARLEPTHLIKQFAIGTPQTPWPGHLGTQPEPQPKLMMENHLQELGILAVGYHHNLLMQFDQQHIWIELEQTLIESITYAAYLCQLASEPLHGGPKLPEFNTPTQLTLVDMDGIFDGEWQTKAIVLMKDLWRSDDQVTIINKTQLIVNFSDAPAPELITLRLAKLAQVMRNKGCKGFDIRHRLIQQDQQDEIKAWIKRPE
jgi:hypothetical protein